MLWLGQQQQPWQPMQPRTPLGRHIQAHLVLQALPCRNHKERPVRISRCPAANSDQACRYKELCLVLQVRCPVLNMDRKLLPVRYPALNTDRLVLPVKCLVLNMAHRALRLKCHQTVCRPSSCHQSVDKLHNQAVIGYAQNATNGQAKEDSASNAGLLSDNQPEVHRYHLSPSGQEHHLFR